MDLALAGLRAPAFELQLAGVGTFEKAGRVTALWVGVERTAALEHLQAKVETALQRAGLEPERRRFVPHVTLARLGEGIAAGKVAGWVQAHNLFRSEPMDGGPLHAVQLAPGQGAGSIRSRGGVPADDGSGPGPAGDGGGAAIDDLVRCRPRSAPAPSARTCRSGRARSSARARRPGC